MPELDFLTGYDAPAAGTGTMSATPPAQPRDTALDFLTQDTPSQPSPTGGDGQSLGWGDIGSSLIGGIRHGFGDINQTFGGTNQTESPAAAPFGWPDLTNPGGALSKFAYRMGESSPTLAAGVAGGTAGTALTGGPWGGIAGGALGAAAGSALQTLGPAFQHELKASPSDPDGAWSRALRSAMMSGAFSGAAWAAFPMKFFEGPVKNAAFQILGVQPGLSALHQGAENIAHDRPALEGVPGAYAEGAIGTAVPMAGAAAIRGLGRATGLIEPKAATKGPPTQEDLEGTARDRYQNIEKWGVYYTNPKELENLRDSIHGTLYNAGVDPRTEGRIFTAVDSLTQSRRPNGTVDWTDIDHARKMLNNALSDRDPTVKRGAAIAIGELDKWIEDAGAQQRAGVDPAVAPALASTAKEARSYWRAAKAMEAWSRVQEKIDTASNPETARRTAVRQIITNPKANWQYPPEALELMRASLDNKGFLNTLNSFTKWFSPHSATGLITDFMTHHFAGPMGLAAPILSELVRRRVNAPLERTTEQVPRMIGAVPTGGLPKQLGVLGRTERDYMPWMGPIVPQQQKRGGAVKRDDGGDVGTFNSRWPGINERLQWNGQGPTGYIEDRSDDAESGYLHMLAQVDRWRHMPPTMEFNLPQAKNYPRQSGNLPAEMGYYDIGRSTAATQARGGAVKRALAAARRH